MWSFTQEESQKQSDEVSHVLQYQTTRNCTSRFSLSLDFSVHFFSWQQKVQKRENTLSSQTRWWWRKIPEERTGQLDLSWLLTDSISVVYSLRAVFVIMMLLLTNNARWSQYRHHHHHVTSHLFYCLRGKGRRSQDKMLTSLLVTEREGGKEGERKGKKGKEKEREGKRGRRRESSESLCNPLLVLVIKVKEDMMMIVKNITLSLTLLYIYSIFYSIRSNNK